MPTSDRRLSTCICRRSGRSEARRDWVGFRRPWSAYCRPPDHAEVARVPPEAGPATLQRRRADVNTRGPIYKISYDLAYDYRKFIVRSTYDSDLKRAEICLKNIVR